MFIAMNRFRIVLGKEKEIEIEKFKNAIDSRFDLLEKSVSNHDSQIEKVSSTINMIQYAALIIR